MINILACVICLFGYLDHLDITEEGDTIYYDECNNVVPDSEIVTLNIEEGDYWMDTPKYDTSVRCNIEIFEWTMPKSLTIKMDTIFIDADVLYIKKSCKIKRIK